MRLEELLRSRISLCSKYIWQLTVSLDVLLGPIEEVITFICRLEWNGQVTHRVSMCLEVLHTLIELGFDSMDVGLRLSV